MNLQEIKAHILGKIGPATIGVIQLDGENFPVDGLDSLHQTMRIAGLELQIRPSEIDVHTGGYLRVPAQKATIRFQAGADFSLVSSDFEIRIHQNGSLYLEWESSFSQFSFDGLLDMGWLPENVELPQLSFAELTIRATTLQNGQAPHYTLGARLPEPYEILPALDARLDEAMLGFSGFNDDSPSQFGLTGQLRVGESQLGVEIAIPTSGTGPWTFSLQSGDSPFSLEDLFQLVGGVNIFQELPGELNIADVFALNELYIEYDFAGKNLNLLRIVIGLGDWDLFYGMAIRNSFLSLELTNPTRPDRNITTLIGGEYLVGEVANLAAELFIPSDGSDWELQATGGLGGDGQGFLSAVAGDIAVAEWLPDGLSDPALVVNEFFLRFNPGKRKILQTRVNVGIDVEWVIIDDLLSLSNPYFAFDIVFPQNPEAEAARVLDLYIQTEKSNIVDSLSNLSSQLNELSGLMRDAQKLIDTAKPGELANKQAEYRTIFLKKLEGLQQRFATEVRKKLQQLEALENNEALKNNAEALSLLRASLKKLGLGANPPATAPIKTLQTKLESCQTSLRGSLFSEAAGHSDAAKNAAGQLLAEINRENLQPLPEKLKNNEDFKQKSKTQVSALLGGEIGIADSTLHVLASRDANMTWRFLGQLEGGLPLLATAKQFLSIDETLPFGLDNLTLNILEAEIVVPPKTQQKPSFRFATGASDLWSIDIGDFNLSAEAVIFSIEHKGPGQTSGKIAGAVEFNGMNFAASYAFGPGRKELALDWEGIAGIYTSQQTDSYLTLTVNNKSIGDIISMLVRVANPGLGTYRLPEPWDFLDKIVLNFSLKYYVKGTRKGQLEFIYTFPDPLDLVVIQITGISVTRIGKSVTISIAGLDHPAWDAADPASPPPQAPGLAERLIDLRLLAMGRHVSLANPQTMANMKEAITALRQFTLPTNEGLPDTVVFNPRSNWLIGMDFGLLQIPSKPPSYAIQLSALFNDPDIYGLRIELNGDKIPPLKGLKFEILYTKINDSIGKYHLELVLPDILRYIEMGAVSIVLPVIVVDVFTNGDFFLDLGFPYEFDFRRSFSITVIVLGVPVLGSGGFYIGKYSPATLPRPVPVSFYEKYNRAIGEFNPTMVFGLGLQIGVGKYFQKGPLTARFSLTLIGMIEGIVATFNPAVAEDSPQQSKDINKSNYVYLRGAIGIIGILEGAVDFKIIKAHVLIRLDVIVQIIYESYCVMPITLSAGVKVQVSVKIDLGLFDITIKFSFSARITATFEVGEDRHLEAPWFQRPSQQQRSLFATARGLSGPLLDLTPLPEPAAPKEKLTLYATLQPTVAWDAEKKPVSQLVFSLVVEAPAEGAPSTGATPFEKMADSIFRWVGQKAYKDGTEASIGNLRQLLNELRGDSLDILPYAQLKQHLQGQFDLEVLFPIVSEKTSIQGTPFPVFPFLKMEVKDGAETQTVNFGGYGMCSEAYLSFLSRYFEATMARVEDPEYIQTDLGSATAATLSLTEQLFEDYFLGIARGMVEETITWLEETQRAGSTFAEAIAALRERQALARLSGQLARFYMGGQRLPKNAGLVLTAEPATFDDRFGIFQVTGQQFAQAGTGAPAISLASSETLPRAWVLPATPYAAPKALLDRLTAFATEAAAPPVFLSKNLATPYQNPPRRYPLTRAIDWASNGSYLLEFPENLLRQLTRNAGALSGLRIEKPLSDEYGNLIVDDTTRQAWQGATLVQIDIKKTTTPYAFEIIGTDEAGIALLEKIILDNPNWEELHLCYQPVDPNQGLTLKKMESPAAAGFLAFIAQINLSTETNPIQGRSMMAMARGLTPSGILDEKDFVERLWAASIVRTGGHYLYFQKADGNSLPAGLFGQDDTARIHLLIRFAAGAPKRYMNYAVAGRDLDVQNNVVFARDPDFTDQMNELQPGHLLLEATRNQPAGDSANTLAHLFHLLSYEVQAGDQAAFQSAVLQLGGETERISSSPISPKEEASTGRWHYEQIVPAFRFAKPDGLLFEGGAAFPNVFLPDPAQNPYAGVGRSISVQLQTRDIYGNAIPDHKDQVAEHMLHYSDPLIPLHQWPEAICTLGLQNKAVVVTLALKPAANASAKDLRKAMLFYEKIYFQLFQQDAGGKAHLRADLRSTLLGDQLNAQPEASPDLNLLLQLRTFAAQAYDYLKKKTRDPNHPVTLPKVDLVRTFTSDQINNATIFELLTEVQLRRTAHIHPDFAAEEAVSLARTPIKPFSTEAINSQSWETALPIFAGALETTFPALKLATGFDKEDLDNYEQRKDLFLVHIDRLQWAKSEPAALALPPLSTRLIDRTVDVGVYSKENGWRDTESNQQVFTAVDMDDWARLFLGAFDNLLSPELAGAIYLLDKEALERLLASKKALAAAMAGKLKPVLAGQTADRASATEKLKQRLLQKLSEAYEVNAVVQYPATFANPHTGEEIRLYGAPLMRQDAAGQTYTLSTAKIPAKASSYLDFLFTTKTARKESSVKLDLAFKATHLEYRITDDPRFEGYQASSWLSFVIPPDPTDLGSIDIPVVLRDFPEAPVLLAQIARQSDDVLPGMTAKEVLRVATGWDYLIQYNQRLTAQDWLQVEVQFNLPEKKALSARNLGRDLFDILAAFAFHWPTLGADLRSLLPQVTPQSIGALDHDTKQQALHAIASFDAMARMVANTWASWSMPPVQLVGFENASAKIFAVMEEKGANGRLKVNYQDLNAQAAADIPQPALLAGPKEEEPGNLPYDQANAQPLRTLALRQINILAYQNAIAAVYLTRNEMLVEGRKSDPAFVYYTPQTKFPNPIIPLLSNDIEVNIGELLPGKNPLVNYLSRFFQDLFEKVHFGEDRTLIGMQLECSYAYKLADDPAQPFVRLPVVLAPSRGFNLAADTAIDATSLSGQLAREIKEWFDAEQPAPGNVLARLIFDVAVFSTTSSNRQPVLRLRNVVLEVKELT